MGGVKDLYIGMMPGSEVIFNLRCIFVLIFVFVFLAASDTHKYLSDALILMYFLCPYQRLPNVGVQGLCILAGSFNDLAEYFRSSFNPATLHATYFCKDQEFHVAYTRAFISITK